MRSRFSAFAVGDAGYLLETWHPSTRPASLELDEGIRWFRLDIVDRVAGGLLDDTGTVEFIARYRMRPPAAQPAVTKPSATGEAVATGPIAGGPTAPREAAAAISAPAEPATQAMPRTGAGEQHERSRFARVAGRWYYVDAV